MLIGIHQLIPILMIPWIVASILKIMSLNLLLIFMMTEHEKHHFPKSYNLTLAFVYTFLEGYCFIFIFNLFEHIYDEEASVLQPAISTHVLMIDAELESDSEPV
jgi:FtsH-binding integral membrane protein